MHKRSGFTIVELLIVIVVIAILASITVVSFNGIQQRARLSQRASDVSSIRKALEIYKTEHGVYPAHTSVTAANLPPSFTGSYGCPTCYGYSVATNNTWLKTLVDSKIIAQAPVDPINDRTNFYMYWTNNVGSPATGCPGPLYVLAIESPGAGAMLGSKAVNCPSYANFSVSADRAVFSNI